jgi:hypothetical protein
VAVAVYRRSLKGYIISIMPGLAKNSIALVPTKTIFKQGRHITSHEAVGKCTDLGGGMGGEVILHGGGGVGDDVGAGGDVIEVGGSGWKRKPGVLVLREK